MLSRLVGTEGWFYQLFSMEYDRVFVDSKQEGRRVNIVKDKMGHN